MTRTRPSVRYRRRLHAVALAALALADMGQARAEIIDRVMAVVNGSVISQSDVEALVRFGLAPQPAAGPAELVERLIDRRLTMVEVNRYSPAEPAAAVVESRLGEVRRRFASDEAFDRALEEVGLTAAQLRAYLRDDLRIQAYLRQRFGAGYQPSEPDILQYYRTHPNEFTRSGVLLTYGEAYDDARAAVIAARREQQIGDWLSGLRRRADIIVPSGGGQRPPTGSGRAPGAGHPGMRESGLGRSSTAIS